MPGQGGLNRPQSRDRVADRSANSRQRIILEGDIPSPANPPSGCRFHTRCPFAEDICTKAAPMLDLVDAASGQLAACHMTQPGSGHSAAPARGKEARKSA